MRQFVSKAPAFASEASCSQQGTGLVDLKERVVLKVKEKVLLGIMHPAMLRVMIWNHLAWLGLAWPC